MVEQVAAPKVGGAVAARLREGVYRHLVETGDDDIVLLGWLIGVEVHDLAVDTVRNPVAEGVGHGISHGLALNVEGVHADSAVQGQLDR